MHFHLLTYTLKTSLLHCKHLPCLLKCLLHHFRPPQTVIIRNRISDEVEWLKTAYTTNIWTAWARYQSQRSHHTRKPDIQAVIPLINAPVHRLDTQYHCMEIAEKTQLLNPAQICIDESDQPVYKLSKELQ